MTKSNGIELLAGERQVGETDKAAQACNDWLRLGTGRTMPRLLERYRDLPQNTAPTTSLDTLQSWSKRFDWQVRAAEFDAGWEQLKNAEREAVLSYGLSLDYERIRKLYRLAEFLESQLYARAEDGTYPNVWLPDVKSIGSGENAERVDIERFNNGLVEQYRKVLEDIAKETGGRVQRQDMTSGGQAVQIIFSQVQPRDNPPD